MYIPLQFVYLIEVKNNNSYNSHCFSKMFEGTNKPKIKIRSARIIVFQRLRVMLYSAEHKKKAEIAVQISKIEPSGVKYPFLKVSIYSIN